jgi:hypothetical protein
LAKLKSPEIIESVFEDSDFQILSKYLNHVAKSLPFDSGFGRFTGSQFDIPILKEYTDKVLSKAREVFDSPTLLPTYSLFAHYETNRARLWKHIDDNACTYTLDMCVYQNFPWDLWVDNQSYTLHPNQALAYYGNDQEHWRDSFPYPELQHVAMVFFHFAEPDHWWFTKGQSYLSVIRKEMTDLEWEQSRVGKTSSTL